jgi:aldose 1-epimerase
LSAEKAFTFLPLGAIIQEFKVDGVNIVQGFPTAELYKKW